MFRISKDSPAYYLTSVAKDRLPVFRKVNIQEIICKAITEARTSAGFLLFAYALMPDHLHTIVGSWDHHPNAKLLTSEDVFVQKVRYVHQNPVRAGLVEVAEDYRFSSARIWARRPLEDEPLLLDIDQIQWSSRR
jgi:REP element-mobilizing transposase RayT